MSDTPAPQTFAPGPIGWNNAWARSTPRHNEPAVVTREPPAEATREPERLADQEFTAIRERRQQVLERAARVGSGTSERPDDAGSAHATASPAPPAFSDWHGWDGMQRLASEVEGDSVLTEFVGLNAELDVDIEHGNSGLRWMRSVLRGQDPFTDEQYAEMDRTGTEAAHTELQSLWGNEFRANLAAINKFLDSHPAGELIRRWRYESGQALTNDGAYLQRLLGMAKRRA